MQPSVRTLIAWNLRRLMAERQIRGNDLAASMGVCYTVISRWRCGHQTPGHDNIDRLAVALKVPVTELFHCHPNTGSAA